MNRKVVTYAFNSKLVGRVLVPNIEMLVCAGCGYKMLTASAASDVSAFVKAKEAAAIGNLPVKLFLSLEEAADRFRLSKQAISKHPKIKNGFVITLKKGRSTWYYRPSLEAFYASGDGRIAIGSTGQNTVVIGDFGGRDEAAKHWRANYGAISKLDSAATVQDMPFGNVAAFEGVNFDVKSAAKSDFIVSLH